MAIIANPRKQFQFRISIPGINPFLVQKVRMPDVEVEVIEHGDTNFDVKTGGRKKVGMLSIEKLAPADGLDDSLWQWIHSIQNTATGGGAFPSQYKSWILIEELSTDGVTSIRRQELEGCWPSKINGIELDRASSGNTIESIDFAVDDIPPPLF